MEVLHVSKLSNYDSDLTRQKKFLLLNTFARNLHRSLYNFNEAKIVLNKFSLLWGEAQLCLPYDFL